MNTKNLIFMMKIVFFSLLLSCEKNEIENDPVIHDYRVDDVLYAKGSKLKRVYQVFDNSKNLVSEYQYDDFGEISRVDFLLARRYDIYQYNAKRQLETISTFDEYLENSPVLIQTISFTYDANGNEVKMLYEWENLNHEKQTYYYLYYYSGKRLTKRESYKDDQLSSFVLFEYKNGLLKKEKLYVPDSDDFLTTEHSYHENLLIYSVSYIGNPESGFSSDIKLYYDHNDNLIKTISNIPALSSTITTDFFSTMEYEYDNPQSFF